MFLLNSRFRLFTVASTGSGRKPFTMEAPLIPKLRGYFAEFLNESFLEHLRLFALPTCVSFSTGTPSTA